jgi:hypothetical protein
VATALRRSSVIEEFSDSHATLKDETLMRKFEKKMTNPFFFGPAHFSFVTLSKRFWRAMLTQNALVTPPPKRGGYYLELWHTKNASLSLTLSLSCVVQYRYMYVGT